jgi:hypothetical protein
VFRRHRSRKDDAMRARESLAEAEAARRAQERKHAAEQPLTARMDRLIEENDLAAALRKVLAEPRGRR